MTIIVGLVHNETVYMGCDSAGVAGLNLSVREDRKIFAVETPWFDKMLIGFTSSFRMGQILRYSFTPPKIGTEDHFKYMCSDFIEKVREALKRGGYACVENGVEHGGHFLVALKGRLFYVGSDFQVGENMFNYDAVGCGDSYAKAALYVTQNTKEKPTSRIVLALSAAAAFSAGCCRPFYVYSISKDNEVKEETVIPRITD